MRKFFLLFTIFLLLSFSGVSLKKRISDSQYRYEFYTTDDIVSAKSNREYYWFKGGAIHNTEYGMAGELLHDEFAKFYHSNQLAESGKFSNGLKTGYWKDWYMAGTLRSKVYWNEGQKDGICLTYNEGGNLVEEGKYKNNKKHGRWINHISHDTLKFDEGNIVLKKVKDTVSMAAKKPGFFKRLIAKKDKQSTNDESIATPNREKEKTKGFWRKLVSGKEKTNKKGAPKELKQKERKTDSEKEKRGLFNGLFTKKEKKKVKNG